MDEIIVSLMIGKYEYAGRPVQVFSATVFLLIK